MSKFNDPNDPNDPNDSDGLSSLLEENMENLEKACKYRCLGKDFFFSVSGEETGMGVRNGISFGCCIDDLDELTEILMRGTDIVYACGGLYGETSFVNGIRSDKNEKWCSNYESAAFDLRAGDVLICRVPHRIGDSDMSVPIDFGMRVRLLGFDSNNNFLVYVSPIIDRDSLKEIGTEGSDDFLSKLLAEKGIRSDDLAGSARDLNGDGSLIAVSEGSMDRALIVRDVQKELLRRFYWNGVGAPSGKYVSGRYSPDSLTTFFVPVMEGAREILRDCGLESSLDEVVAANKSLN